MVVEAVDTVDGWLTLCGQWPGQLDMALLLWISLALAGVAILIGLWRKPGLLVWLPCWVLAHTLYRVRVFGRQNVPSKGPALLVCNHVSYLDWLFLLVAQRRFVHFVIFAGWTRRWGLRHLLRWAGVIPIDGSAGPRAVVHSLRLAGDALARGEVVCIFAEGRFTRTGFLLPFHRGFEQIVKRTPAPIIPVCLEQVWGSIFSYRGGKLLWKWPQQIPYPVTVIFGEPLAPTATAVEVRQVIQKLSADSSVRRADRRMPVHRQFLRLATRHPFRSCLIDPTNPKKPLFKYGEVLVGAKIMTNWLRPRLADDAMVGLWLPPSAGGAVANIALAFLGKTSVNLNYTSSPAGVQSAVRQCGIRRVLTSRLFTSRVPLEAGPGVEVIYLDELRKEMTAWLKWRTFASLLLCWPLPAFLRERWMRGIRRHRPDDLATVIFSSGSTGEPKGVMLTHGNIAANIESVVQAIDPGPRDRLLGILPFFHSFGYTVTLWVPLQVGASIVYHADPRQAKEIGELCRKYAATIFLATPTFLRFCLKRCGPDDFRSLRILMCGAEKLPPGLAEEVKQKFGVQPLEGYGCTELSPVAAANVPDQELDAFRQIGTKPGTIGQPVPGVAARIVNADTFEPLPPGQEGLLLIYGANVMKGYLGKPEATHEAVRDGWYVTGDIARFDEDGFITITDRLARFSKVGGEMVPHQKVEDELHTILGTSDRTCVVTAVPDEGKGERLVVLYTPLGSLDVHQLWQRLTDRGLPNIYIPKERDFFPIPELPVLGTGKVDLKRVKELALEKARG
jgi:acyl-[acyl-carrier-protein]-phospholipid O-acyltransferase/long-chain-fatty-acid--[acyl-carrier-protein] ligase